MGARGLGGMSYFLHVFWDTRDLRAAVLHLHAPADRPHPARYRFRNLAGAREKAAHMGHKGALYPWESADKGVETTPPYGCGPDGEMVPILSGLMEHHISADVAWGVVGVLEGAPATTRSWPRWAWRCMLETARFWASRSALDADGRYHIRMVVGPDEYHEGVDDNAYTNVLARWNIRKAVEALPGSAGRLGLRRRAVPAPRARTTRRDRRLAHASPTGWPTASTRRRSCFEQFAGFYEMDRRAHREARARGRWPPTCMLGRDVTLNAKVVKQADVVMLCHILSDELGDDVGGQLRVLRAHHQSWQLAQPRHSRGGGGAPGQLDDAVDDFKMAAAIDLADNMGNAARGLHMATMGGLWQAAVMGFAGLQRRDEALLIDPHLPPAWKKLAYRCAFVVPGRSSSCASRRRASRLGITIERAALKVILDGTERVLHPGRHRYLRRPRTNMAGGRRMMPLVAVEDRGGRPRARGRRADSCGGRWVGRRAQCTCANPAVPIWAAPIWTTSRSSAWRGTPLPSSPA